jgi:hypothetical protein
MAVGISGVLFNRPLTLTLSRRERGLTEVSGRCAATCEFEPNSGFEKHEDRLPFPLTLLKLRGLTEVFGRCAATCELEPNSGFEKHEDRLPFPLSLRERAGVRGEISSPPQKLNPPQLLFTA